MYFWKLDYKEETFEDDESISSSRVSETDEKRYLVDYEHFLNTARNDLVDVEIKEFLSKQGFGTIKT